MTNPNRYRIVPVDSQNFWAVMALQVAPEQIHFIEPNSVSLAEAAYDRRFDWHPYALMQADTVVGFAMVGAWDREEQYIWLDRLMIDRRYQHQGIGGIFVELLIPFIFEQWPVKTIVLSYEPENISAEQFYFRHGFHDAHRVDENNGEKIAVFEKAQ